MNALCQTVYKLIWKEAYLLTFCWGFMESETFLFKQEKWKLLFVIPQKKPEVKLPQVAEELQYDIQRNCQAPNTESEVSPRP